VSSFFATKRASYIQDIIQGSSIFTKIYGLSSFLERESKHGRPTTPFLEIFWPTKVTHGIHHSHHILSQQANVTPRGTTTVVTQISSFYDTERRICQGFGKRLGHERIGILLQT
jgi:hypothetical protein